MPPTRRDEDVLRRYLGAESEAWRSSYDAWKTTEPEPMPSVSDVCTPDQDHDAYALWKDLREYREKYGRQALVDLMDEALE